MGMIFNRTLKCENCGYEYHGKGGGHIISNGERYGISQYYCKTCHSIIDLECYSSLKDNVERYIYPDGTKVSCDITKTDKKNNSENTAAKQKDEPPLCRECGKHLYKFNVDSGEYACCPKCGHKSLKQTEVHVSAYVD